jgi:pimeloyl-ACP methyl ester carboxylesterase
MNKGTSGTLYTRDKVAIAYEHYKRGFDSVVIVCPGFFNSKRAIWMRKTVDLISSKHDVIIFDFRGHGDSSGKFSWTAKEHRDVQAVLGYAGVQGYKDIGILAFSLGAAASINAIGMREIAQPVSGQQANRVKSMVLISCPSRFAKIDYHFWKPEMLSDLKDNIECGWEGKGARTTSVFLRKPKPIETIAGVRDTAILFIHGDKDWVIKDYHSRQLYDAADTPKKIKVIKGGWHAQRLIQQYPDKMKKLILGWFEETLNCS